MNIFSLKLSGLAFAALLAGSVAGVGGPAQAAGPAGTAVAVQHADLNLGSNAGVRRRPAGTAVAVQHADLNLASGAGVRRLQSRIRNAAERLCVEPGTISVQQQAQGKACIAATVDAAQPQVRLAIARRGEQQLATVIGKAGY